MLEGQGSVGTKGDLEWGAGPEKGGEGKESHVLFTAMSL